MRAIASMAVRNTPARRPWPPATLLTTARMIRPRTSSMTAAARMIWLARSFKSFRSASTEAVIPTLVATRAAPTNRASLRVPPQETKTAHPAANGANSPSAATPAATALTRKRSATFTSRPMLNSRNRTPRSESALSTSLGAIHPSMLGPTSAPATISPARGGRCRRAKISPSSLADPNTINIATGRGRGEPCTGELFPFREEQQQRKNDHGDHGQQHVKQGLPQPRRAALLPVAQLVAIRDAHLLGMLQILGKLARAGIAIRGVAFDRAINNFLELRRNLGIDFARRDGVVQQPVIHDGKGIGPAERHLPGEHLVEHHPHRIDVA